MAKYRPSKRARPNPMALLQQMQEQLAEAQQQLAEETVTGTAGGGAVAVVLTGDQKCVSVTIDPELLAEGDAEMLQDLLVSAFNNAQEAVQKLSEERLGGITQGLSGLGLPF